MREPAPLHGQPIVSGSPSPSSLDRLTLDPYPIARVGDLYSRLQTRVHTGV